MKGLRVLSFVLSFVLATSALGFAKTLCEAAKKGDTVAVAKFLDSGMDVDTKDDLGRPPLFYAASYGRVATVKLLLQRGADVNWKRDGWTALIAAATVKNGVEGVTLLIAAGADVKAYGSQALKLAMFSGMLSGSIDTVKLLIAAGSDVNAVNDHGVTALWQAAFFNATDFAKLLIAAGADVNFTANGASVLACARARKSQEMIALLTAAGAK